MIMEKKKLVFRERIKREVRKFLVLVVKRKKIIMFICRIVLDA